MCSSDLLFHRADELGLDVDERATTRKASLEVWSANQRVIERARELGTALAAEGVAPVAIKGIGLIGEGLSLDRRPIGDIDLLVPVSDLVVTARVLADHGHRVDYEPGRVALAQRHAVVAPAVDGIWVDLHWRASGGLPVWATRRFGDAPWPTDRSTPVPPDHPLYGTGWRVPAPFDHVALLAVHGCRPSNRRAVHLMADAHLLMAAASADDGRRIRRALDEVGHAARGCRWLQEVADRFGTVLRDEVLTGGRRRGECLAERLERFAAAHTRSSGAGGAALAASVMAGEAALTLTRPWWFPGRVIDRVRWDREARAYTRIEPSADGW